MPLNIGQVLENRYRIDARLGQGGMGAVYLAWHLSLDTPVVVKYQPSDEAYGAARKFLSTAAAQAGL